MTLVMDLKSNYQVTFPEIKLIIKYSTIQLIQFQTFSRCDYIWHALKQLKFNRKFINPTKSSYHFSKCKFGRVSSAK